MEYADFIVVGAGVAGTSVACFLARHARVLVLERESQPGYHSTGRSAALFVETYGPEQVRALIRASRRFFENPPTGFADHPLLSRRGTLTVGLRSQEQQLEQHWHYVSATTSVSRRMSPAEVCALVPIFRADSLVGGIFEPEVCDIDVHALNQGYLRELRRRDGVLHCDCEVTRLERDGGGWRVYSGDRVFVAPVVMNAAGAWADVLARMAGVAPIGLEPRRRSAFLFAPPDGVATASWPAVQGLLDDWYVKPESGLLLGSPANADLVEPHDVQAEELDVALGIDRIESATTLRINRPTRVWAGLRSFVPDGALVGGFDPGVPGFFWVAAQGGYGIETSAAMGESCAALALGRPLPPHLADSGLTAAMLSPTRLLK
ncbi:MAG: FAD-binding oxidoreductase [Proteobacteria bacterium]|nr:FAD-binding oxidoreductase [Pseudomonadota bacterium]